MVASQVNTILFKSKLNEQPKQVSPEFDSKIKAETKPRQYHLLHPQEKLNVSSSISFLRHQGS